MISTQDIDDIIGAEAVGSDNDRIGRVGQVYVDADDQHPTWVSVKSGLFGTSETLVPLDGAEFNDKELHLAFSKDRVKDAPRVEPDAELSSDEQQELYRYYGIGGSTGAGLDDTTGPTAGRPGSDGDGTYFAETAGAAPIEDEEKDRATGKSGKGATAEQDDPIQSDRDRYTAASGTNGTITAGEGGAAAERDTSGRATEGHDTSGPSTDDAMTRSEERLQVGTEKVQTGTARLRKYVVTEQQTVTVPVSHDEVKIEREPITDANRGAAGSGPALSEEEHEVVLTAEEPVVTKETVPVERVRLGTQTVTDQQAVTEDVSHEEITEDDGTTPTTR